MPLILIQPYANKATTVIAAPASTTMTIPLKGSADAGFSPIAVFSPTVTMPLKGSVP